MTNNNTDSDPDFCFPSSSSPHFPYHHQKMRKKRTKMIKIEPSSSNLVSSATASETFSNIVSKPKYYARKPDPSAPKITRPCSECGKKFWSWKALFGHMRCHPERQWRGINPPPNHRRPPVPPIQEIGNVEDQVVVMMTAEDHEVAACLLLLANSDHVSSTVLETECGGGGEGSGIGGGATCSSFHVQEDAINCRFECSSCKKVFGSHQALGGHRASHKNVKGCFAITRSSDGCDMGEENSGIVGVDVKENMEDNHTNTNDNNNNNKMLMVLGHKCSICLRVFSTGQALGGHKRCHWEKGEEASSSMNYRSGLNSIVYAAKENCGLDLNLPAPVEDESSSSYSSGLTLDLRLGL